MREQWQQKAPAVTLDDAQIVEMLRPVFPHAKLEKAQRTSAGLSNVNYEVKLLGRDRPVGLRLFIRDPRMAAKEHALARLIGDRLPVPAVLFSAETNPFTEHPYSVVEWLDGLTVREALTSASAQDSAAIGNALGETLAKQSHVTFPSSGFFGRDLEIVETFDVGSDGFRSWICSQLAAGPGAERMGPVEVERLLRFAEAEAGVLDELRLFPPCLVHSDFDVTNILVKRKGASWVVSGVLDWEFAYSGSIVADIGHILRPPAGIMEGFENAFLDGLVARGCLLPKSWKRMAKLYDLTSWVEFLNRLNAGEGLIRSARGVIDSVISDWNRF